MTLVSRWLAALLMIAMLGPAGPSSAAGKVSDPLPKDQIEQLVAPLALYPDALLTQMLMASTYPLDLVQADRWVQDHPDLQGEALDRAVREEPWDESVKVMVQFPTVLAFMSDNLDWTQDLGDAVLAQLPDVMIAIQTLRREAERAGTLRSNDKLRVEQAGDTIVIQPAQAEKVYVPAYDPAKVYGTAAPPATTYYPAVYQQAATGYAATQPVSYVTSPPPTTVYTTETGNNEGLIGFGAGALVGGLLTAAIMWDDHDDPIYWGGPGYWNRPAYWSQPAYWQNNGWRDPNNISVDRDVSRTRINTGDITTDRGNLKLDGDRGLDRASHWQHNPERRGGVRYRDQATAGRFAEARPVGAISRDEARGRLTSDKTWQTPAQTPTKDRDGIGTPTKGEAPKIGTSAKVDTAKLGTGSKAEGAKLGASDKDKAAKTGISPKADATKAARRPVDAKAKVPTAIPSQGAAKHQASAAALTQARPERATVAGEGAFGASNPGLDRAASQRGAASRATAGRAAGGAGRGGGGEARAGAGRRR